ncbi:MAG: DUF305 domain-containing protein [Patescibacteria group bacterium]
MDTNKLIIAIVGAVIVFFVGYQLGSDRSVIPSSMHMMNGGAMSNNDMNGMMQMMEGMLEGKKGAELDEAFIQTMIPHHAGAVAMCQPVLKDGQREELKSLCRGIVEAQTREIDQMRVWQNQWFK